MPTPTPVKHCVARVAKKVGGDTQKAFAICVSTMQKAGYLRSGSLKLTAAGKRADKRHSAEKDASLKLKRYEKILRNARDATAKEGKKGMKMRIAAQRRQSKAALVERCFELAGIIKKQRPWSLADARRYRVERPVREVTYAGLLDHVRRVSGVLNSGVLSESGGESVAVAARGTVGVFLRILESRLARYESSSMICESCYGDRITERLLRQMESLAAIEKKLKTVIRNSDRRSLSLMKSAVVEHFDAKYPPVKHMFRQVDRYLKSGETPQP